MHITLMFSVILNLFQDLARLSTRSRIKSGMTARGATRSFTLIEILIASAIFVAIITLTVGSFSQSINFGSTATQERVTRQSAKSMTDLITRLIRQANTNQFTIAATDYCDPRVANCPASPSPYVGAGFLFLNLFNDGLYNNRLIVFDPATLLDSTSLIIASNDPTYHWYFIGYCSGNVVMRRGTTVVLGASGTQPNPCNWEDVGQLTSAETTLQQISFGGVPPKQLTYGATGAVTSYGSLSQPFVTISMRFGAKSDPKNSFSYVTTISSRDFNFVYPRCSLANPTTTCN